MIESSRRLRCCAALLAALAGAPLCAGAQVRMLAAPSLRAPTPLVMPLVRQRTMQSGPTKDAIYGVVTAIAGNTITLRARNGRLRTIDATSAMAAGTVSAPLFIGKLVVAEGLSRVNGVLSAARVSRLTRLESANPDR